MIFHITNESPVRNMEEDCELKKMEGLLKDLSIHKTSSGKELILKNSIEILIPEAERKNLLQTLQQSNLTVSQHQALQVTYMYQAFILLLQAFILLFYFIFPFIVLTRFYLFYSY